MPVLAVCLPTYDEAENVEPMVRALGRVFAEHGIDGRLLVVDDGSPDGTGEIADRLAAELGFVEVLHRPGKAGLGAAYRAGFERALATGADVVVQMDCDFSHDPADIPRLLAAAGDADVVIGSRYVNGGGTRNWGLLRRFVSLAGSTYARLLLGLPTRDLTGGFKCYRRDALARIEIDQVSARGYAFQIEVTYRAVRAGLSVVEIPIVFTERDAGASKMGVGIAVEALWRVPALRLRALLGRV
jgi:dolichol-phosphate mannosyltransferase